MIDNLVHVSSSKRTALDILVAKTSGRSRDIVEASQSVESYLVCESLTNHINKLIKINATREKPIQILINANSFSCSLNSNSLALGDSLTTNALNTSRCISDDKVVLTMSSELSLVTVCDIAILAQARKNRVIRNTLIDYCGKKNLNKVKHGLAGSEVASVKLSRATVELNKSVTDGLGCLCGRILCVLLALDSVKCNLNYVVIHYFFTSV